MSAPVALGSNVALTVDGPGATTLSGGLTQASGTNGGSLTKTGAGTLTLSGNNTYTGNTTVSAGTLAVTGSLAGHGTISVASAAMLTGTGSLAGAVNVQAGGAFAPGLDGSGVLTLDNTLTLAGGSQAIFTLGGTVAGSGYTQAVVGGQLALNGATLILNEKLGFSLVVGQTFYLLDNPGITLTQGTFGNAPGGIYTDAAGDTFLVNYLANNPADNSLLGNDVSLTVQSVVPEPSTWALLVLGLAGLGLALRGPRRAVARLPNSAHLGKPPLVKR